MRIAIEGCAHGELEIIYNAIIEAEKTDGKKVDLLLCCGDFQATRNWSDLRCMAVPDKFKDMGTFYKYYSGEKVAPVLTIFVGGNHEASNHLQELAYGGWVAPNIYYLGYAGVVSVAGIRIAGLSGIFKNHDLMKGHHEFPPYNSSTMRSAYHVRNLEIFRLKQLSGNIDIFMTHDWPLGITNYGNVNALLRKKAFFKNDIESDSLGSPPAMELLKHHYPSYWFAAHLHCKFAACVPNDDNTKVTRFLALDKCLPKRKFLQIIEVDHNKDLPIKLSYDLEWLTILFLTNHLLSVKNTICYMPGPVHQGRWIFTPTDEEKEKINKKFNYDLTVPLNFKESVKPFDPTSPNKRVDQPNLLVNEQTTEFCTKLAVDDPFALLRVIAGISDKSGSFGNTLSMVTSSKQTDGNTDLSSSADEEVETEEAKGERTNDREKSPDFVIDTSPTYNHKLLMTPLKLPTAKNDDSTCTSNEEKSSIIENDNSFSKNKKENFQDSSPKNSSKSPRTLEQMMDSETPKGSKEIEPSFKKFKRRNQAIYTDVECT